MLLLTREGNWLFGRKQLGKGIGCLGGRRKHGYDYEQDIMLLLTKKSRTNKRHECAKKVSITR